MWRLRRHHQFRKGCHSDSGVSSPQIVRAWLLHQQGSVFIHTSLCCHSCSVTSPWTQSAIAACSVKMFFYDPDFLSISLHWSGLCVVFFAVSCHRSDFTPKICESSQLFSFKASLLLPLLVRRGFGMSWRGFWSKHTDHVQFCYFSSKSTFLACQYLSHITAKLKWKCFPP